MGRIVKTKTFWGGLASILTGIGMIVATDDATAGIQMIYLGILGIFGRAAVAKIQT